MSTFVKNDKVKTKGFSVYDNQVPKGTEGTVVGFRERYTGTPNQYVQVLVRFPGYTSTISFGDAGPSFAYEEYDLEKV